MKITHQNIFLTHIHCITDYFQGPSGKSPAAVEKLESCSSEKVWSQAMTAKTLYELYGKASPNNLSLLKSVHLSLLNFNRMNKWTNKPLPSARSFTYYILGRLSWKFGSHQKYNRIGQQWFLCNRSCHPSKTKRACATTGKVAWKSWHPRRVPHFESRDICAGPVQRTWQVIARSSSVWCRPFWAFEMGGEFVWIIVLPGHPTTFTANTLHLISVC